MAPTVPAWQEALVAARLGAHVLAMDVNPLALALLRHAADAAGLAVQTQSYDLLGEELAPSADVLVCADLLYNDELAEAVGRRCGEALAAADASGSELLLLVTDSQRFSGGGDAFRRGLLAALPSAKHDAAAAALQWQTEHLEAFTGSGILIEEDQTYDVTARFILHRGGL